MSFSGAGVGGVAGCRRALTGGPKLSKASALGTVARAGTGDAVMSDRGELPAETVSSSDITGVGWGWRRDLIGAAKEPKLPNASRADGTTGVTAGGTSSDNSVVANTGAGCRRGLTGAAKESKSSRAFLVGLAVVVLAAGSP